MGPLDRDYFQIGDLVERIDPAGGSLGYFKVGDRAIVTKGLSNELFGDLIELDNGVALYPFRLKKVEEREIPGDDDEDCI